MKKKRLTEQQIIGCLLEDSGTGPAPATPSDLIDHFVTDRRRRSAAQNRAYDMIMRV